MRQLDRLLAMIFGFALLALALAVAVETTMRKVFNKSLQGVDELGGYILAVTAALSFAVALHARTHIRIDLLHDYFPRTMRALLNVVAMMSIALCALAALYMAWLGLQDTISFNATAQTPWATPLKYPQTIWVIALALFAGVAVLEAARAVMLLITAGPGPVDRTYGPRGAKDELDEELADLKSRGVGGAASAPEHRS